MADWIGSTVIGLSLVVMVIGVLFVVFSRRNLPTVALASFLFLWGLVTAWLNGIGMSWFGLRETTDLAVSLIVWNLGSSATLVLAIVYPNLAITRTLRVLLIIVFSIFLAGILWLLATPWEPEALLPLRRWAHLHEWLSLPLGFAVLGLRWIRARGAAYRDQVFWGMMAYWFWCVHDTGIVVFALGQTGGLSQIIMMFQDPWIAPYTAALALGSLGALSLAGHSLYRLMTGTADAGQRTLVLLTPFLLALTTLQVYDNVHLLVDYLAAAFVVYGVLRFNVIDLNIRIKWGLSKGTVAAVFLAVFFVASELATVLFEGLAGNVVVGIVAAGVLVLFLAPLQRVAETFAQKAMPQVEPGEPYRDYRRFQIYRVALEGAMQDDALEPSETRSLANLRQQLNISMEDHQAMEQEVRERLSAPLAPAQEPRPGTN